MRRSYTRGHEEIGKKELWSLDRRQTKVKDSRVQSTKIHKPVSFGDSPIKKTQGRNDEIGLAYENNNFDYPGEKVSMRRESFPTSSTMPLEKDHRVMQFRGNQELNG